MIHALLVTALGLSSGTSPSDWPNWRGPNHDGSAQATGLSTSFSKSEGIAWSTPLPGPGASSPVVIGGRVFLTSTDPLGGELLAICLDAETGEERWIVPAGSGYKPGGKGSKTEIHNRSNYASPSPTSDGERVLFLFGNGDLAAFSLTGEPIWTRNIQKDLGDFGLQWTFSTSPTLWKGKVYIPVLQRDQPVGGIATSGGDSYLLALDAKTGETLFQVTRPSQARMESLESYATAIPHVGTDGRAELLVVGGDVITGHDPQSGKELWRWGTWNEGHRERAWRLVPSPVLGAGVVLACGPKGAPASAVRLGGEGDLGDDALVWQSAGRRDPVTTDVPTPLFFDGAFFVLSDLREALTRVKADTGEQEWTLKLSGDHRWRASPTGADGKIWIMDHGGNVVVVDAQSGKILHTAAMGTEDEDSARAPIAVAQDSLFIRTSGTVYRVGR
ncbi:MAG: outer membrane protein assembly factor BamB [Chlamydiales bacterium]|jgi:outer membrane protein assembly factor BamB